MAFNLPYDEFHNAIASLRGETVHVVEGGESLSLTHHTLPPLFFWDRMRFIAHKKSGVATSFGVQWLSKTQPFFGPCEGALVALTPTMGLDKILVMLKDLEITLGDITSLPLIGFAKEGRGQEGYTLLAWQNSDTSLSQVFIHHNIPLMTRLTPPLGRAATAQTEMADFTNFLIHHRHIEEPIAHHMVGDGAPFDQTLITWWRAHCGRVMHFTHGTQEAPLSLAYAPKAMVMLLGVWIAVSSYEYYGVWQETQDLEHREIMLQKQLKLEKAFIVDEAILESHKPLLGFYLEKAKEIDGLWTHLHALSQVVMERVKIQQIQWLRGSHNDVTLALHVTSNGKDQDVQVHDFETYVTRIKASFEGSEVTIIKAPFNAHPNQLFEGGPGHKASDRALHEGIIQVTIAP